MPSGVRLLTADQERWVLSQAELRDRLSDKAIAKQLGLTVRQVQTLLARLRRKESEKKCTFAESY